MTLGEALGRMIHGPQQPDGPDRDPPATPPEVNKTTVLAQREERHAPRQPRKRLPTRDLRKPYGQSPTTGTLVALLVTRVGRGSEPSIHQLNTPSRGAETMKLICDLAVLSAAAVVVYWTLLEGLL